MEPVVLMQPFDVPDGAEDVFVADWDATTAFLERRAGFVAARLQRSTGGEPGARFVGVTEWESINDFLAAAVATEGHGIGVRFAGVPVLYSDVRSVRAGRDLPPPMRSAA